MGIPNVSIAEYPGVIPLDSSDTMADKVWTKVLPSVVKELSTPAAKVAAAGPAEPQPRDIVFKGTLAEVQEYFEAREWSDGLPFVPPTLPLVEQFLGWTRRDPTEIIAVLPPDNREATVWSVAVNGVMAGCRPEYMPILLGIVEAIADPYFHLEDAGATPGWEPLVVVSGEIVDALEFNTEAGNMRVGRRANSSIGRFLRMYMRNVAGFRPGKTDKGSIGFMFNAAMGENEGAVRDVGWDPLRVDLGFALEDNVVMVQSAMAISGPIYAGGTDPETMIWPLVHHMAGTPGPWNYTAILWGEWHPLVQMTPAVARGFAGVNWGKKEIRRHLLENTKMEARWLEEYALHVGGAATPLSEYVRRGAAPALYAESDDPNRKVPLLLREEWTNIVVAGDPQRNQSRIYINNQRQGAPVARRVVMPDDWKQRLEQSKRPS